MKKPTVEEIEAYIVEKNYQLDAALFWHFYESAGKEDKRGKIVWMRGKNPMSRWKSALFTWHSQGWGKTAKSMAAYKNRNYDRKRHERDREYHEDYLRSMTTVKLVDLWKDPGQLPLWLILEILMEKGVKT